MLLSNIAIVYAHNIVMSHSEDLSDIFAVDIEGVDRDEGAFDMGAYRY